MFFHINKTASMIVSVFVLLENRLYSRVLKQPYPLQIILDSPTGKLKFQAYSAVEKFRISEYGSEKEFLDYFISHIRSDDIIYDIGASVGLITVFSASYAKQEKLFGDEPGLR